MARAAPRLALPLLLLLLLLAATAALAQQSGDGAPSDLACNTAGLCCFLVKYTASSSGYPVPIFDTAISGVTLLSSLYLLLRLCRARRQQIEYHFRMVVLSCVTFLLLVVANLIPLPQEHPAHDALSIIHCLCLAAQWFVQLSVVLVMFSPSMRREVVRNTVIVTLAVCALFSAAWLLSYFVDNCECTAEVVIESTMLVFFVLVLVVSCGGCARFRLAVRPASRRWGGFMLVVHTLFLLNYLLEKVAPFTEGKECMYIVANCFYSILYAPFLYSSLTSDSRFFVAQSGSRPLEEGSGALGSDEATSLLAHSAAGDDAVAAVVKTHVEKLLRTVKVKLIPLRELSVGRVIGAGVHGEVFHARWLSTDVAFKKLRVAVSVDDVDSPLVAPVLMQFLHEGELLTRLRHPNIVLLLGVVVEPPTLGLVTEFVERGSLFDLLSCRRRSAGVARRDGLYGVHPVRPDLCLLLPARTALSMLRDVARGLLFLHGSNVIHRDLKSHNLLVDRSWSVKVADFGISKAVEAATATMTAGVGTPQWMAPEVLRSETYSTTADIYSFGVVCWELFSSRAPFETLSPLHVIQLVSLGKARLWCPEGVPRELQALVDRCLSDRLEERPTLEAVLAVLESLLAGDLSALEDASTCAPPPALRAPSTPLARSSSESSSGAAHSGTSG